MIEEVIHSHCMDKMHLVFGETIPDFALDRFKEEYHEIETNELAGMFYQLYEVKGEMNRQNLELGFNGTLCNSYIAFLLELTDINPLPGFYYCRECSFTEEVKKENMLCMGIDLPAKFCPNCGRRMQQDGFNISWKEAVSEEGTFKPHFDLLLANAKVKSQKYYVLENHKMKLFQFLYAKTGVKKSDVPMDELKLDMIARYKEQFLSEKFLEICEEIKPQSINDLCSIYGMANGMGTWEGNAEILVKEQRKQLNELITTRDDLHRFFMRYEIAKQEVPKYIVESSKKIEYLWPRGACISEMISTMKLAWFRENYPEEFSEAKSLCV